ncbi:hypothetical protein ACFVGL_37100, partial [Streptomyces tubercidicus]
MRTARRHRALAASLSGTLSALALFTAVQIPGATLAVADDVPMPTPDLPAALEANYDGTKPLPGVTKWKDVFRTLPLNGNWKTFDSALAMSNEPQYWVCDRSRTGGENSGAFIEPGSHTAASESTRLIRNSQVMNNYNGDKDATNYVHVSTGTAHEWGFTVGASVGLEVGAKAKLAGELNFSYTDMHTESSTHDNEFYQIVPPHHLRTGYYGDEVVHHKGIVWEWKSNWFLIEGQCSLRRVTADIEVPKGGPNVWYGPAVENFCAPEDPGKACIVTTGIGEPYSIDVEVAPGSSSPGLRWSANNLPPNAEINPATGVISTMGIPDGSCPTDWANDKCKYSVEVKVEDTRKASGYAKWPGEDATVAPLNPTGGFSFDWIISRSKLAAVPPEASASHADPVAVSTGPNNLDLFVQGADGSLYRTNRSTGVWGPQWNAVSGAPQGDRIAAVSQSDGQRDIFARGADNRVWFTSWNASSQGWKPWQSMDGPTGGTFKGVPAVTSWGPGNLSVFVRGNDDAVWYKTTNDGDLVHPAWQSLGGSQTSSPTAAVEKKTGT